LTIECDAHDTEKHSNEPVPHNYTDDRSFLYLGCRC